MFSLLYHIRLDSPHELCACGAPLLARYRLEEAAAALDRDRLEGQTLWRYHAMLPVQSPAGVVSLGEG